MGGMGRGLLLAWEGSFPPTSAEHLVPFCGFSELLLVAESLTVQEGVRLKNAIRSYTSNSSCLGVACGAKTWNCS